LRVPWLVSQVVFDTLRSVSIPSQLGVTKSVTTGTFGVTALEKGRDAASRGDWQQAHDLLAEADAGQSLDRADLPLRADVAYAAGHLDVSLEVWERAHAQALRAGDSLTAAGAAARVAMHLLFDTALMAPVRGWIKRAERLLEGHDETPVHAWVAVARNYERLLSGDFPAARQWARRAIELGTKYDPAAAAIGRIAEARSLILDGEVQQGLALLDEAAVATVSGELDPFLTGVVYCELVCALQAVAQYDLAEEWTQAMERWRQGRSVGSIHGRCRVHRAEILRLRGSSDEAEREALLACEELRPYLRREFGWPLTELGRIRLRKGDVEGAEQAFVSAHEAGWDPQPGLALVFLAKGDVALAAGSIRNALEHPRGIPSKELPPNTELLRAPLLDAQVEIAVAAGDLERARWAAEELGTIASRFGSKALTAGASTALGIVRLAEGDAGAARRDFEEAVRLWNEVGAPYETAVARMGLAQAHRDGGDEERALLEFRAARSGFERVGAVQHAERAAHACAPLSSRASAPALRSASDEGRDLAYNTRSQASGAERRAPPASQLSEFRREGEYWCVTFEGHTTRLRDAKGLRYIIRLLADPGRAFHVLDLVAVEHGQTADLIRATESGATSSALGDAGEMLDARAKEAYRRRLAEIEEDIEEARSFADSERQAQAETERDFLIRELSRAVGLGGRDRRAGSATERARVSVTRAVRAAMIRLREHSPALGAHLDRSIRTGIFCDYLPESRVPVE
jgi:tetratricopeptide (TPR) repeat protein